jgi:hypothetical protein
MNYNPLIGKGNMDVLWEIAFVLLGLVHGSYAAAK